MKNVKRFVTWAIVCLVVVCMLRPWAAKFYAEKAVDYISTNLEAVVADAEREIGTNEYVEAAVNMRNDFWTDYLETTRQSIEKEQQMMNDYNN